MYIKDYLKQNSYDNEILKKFEYIIKKKNAEQKEKSISK
jgi:hypothetical protein